MAIFFFVVGLEIKLELRQGSLSSVKKACLPCIAALGGMVTPMLVYLGALAAMGGGSMAALTVPMATDIAFAMAIFGFFRSRMPASSSVFLLTLATVDDLGGECVRE
jgi:NhaA family Na+:H+ antiporter